MREDGLGCHRAGRPLPPCRGNTAHGTNVLLNTTTGGWNVGVGGRAGLNATTGFYNGYLGAEVQCTVADANTMRLGLPYSGGVGQNQTFIAGIHGTQLTGPAVQVFVDANGQLGTLLAPIATRPERRPRPRSPANNKCTRSKRSMLSSRRRLDHLSARLARLEAAARVAKRQ